MAILESSLAQLRSQISEELQAKSIPPAMLDAQVPVTCTNVISSIQMDLRNLNRRIRKNVFIIHGLEKSMKDCNPQAEAFLQTHLKLKLPMEQAYRFWLVDHRTERPSSRRIPITTARRTKRT